MDVYPVLIFKGICIYDFDIPSKFLLLFWYVFVVFLVLLLSSVSFFPRRAITPQGFNTGLTAFHPETTNYNQKNVAVSFFGGYTCKKKMGITAKFVLGLNHITSGIMFIDILPGSGELEMFDM